MPPKISERLLNIVNALPLEAGLRVLEIGCGTGAMAREISKRIGKGHVLAIDRSAKAIQQAIKSSTEEIESGRLAYKRTTIETFEMDKSDKPYDIAVAIRVGALDGRHPEIEQQALKKIAEALKKNGKLFIDGGDMIKQLSLKKFL